MFKYYFAIICLPIFVRSVSVQIDGFIDVGSRSNNQYNLGTAEDHAFAENDNLELTSPKENKKSRRHKKVLFTVMEAQPRVTKQTTKPKNIFKEPLEIKQSNKINEFTYHIYKLSLRMFDEVRQKINPEFADQLEAMTRIFDDKFRNFMNETMYQKIKTRLGSQKVILNTIETSSQIKRRLMNHLILDMKRKSLLSSNPAIPNILRKAIDRESKLERVYVCSKFGICRTTYGFSEFLTDFITTILQSNIRRIKQAADAITEVLKNTDLKNVMNRRTKIKLLHKIDKIEIMDDLTVKFMFIITRNLIAHKNKPIVVIAAGDEHINRTVACLEVIDILDNALPPNAENTLEWADLKTSIIDWKDKKRNDVLEIMHGLVSHMKRGLDQLDDATAGNMNDKFDLLLK